MSWAADGDGNGGDKTCGEYSGCDADHHDAGDRKYDINGEASGPNHGGWDSNGAGRHNGDDRDDDGNNNTKASERENQAHHSERRPMYKIFIGGLSRNTTSDSVQEYFSKFGPIVEAAVVCDKDTGRSRGFGFCTYSLQESMQSALNATHKLDGAELRVALPKEETRSSEGPSDGVDQPGRIFVGGLADSVTEDDFREHFEKFGKLSSSTLMYDKDNNRPRGFGFVIYEDANDAAKAIGPHSALGRACEAKKAHPRPRNGRRTSASGRRPPNRRGGNGPANSGRYDDGYRQDAYGGGYDGYAGYYGGYYMPAYYPNPYGRGAGAYAGGYGGYAPSSGGPHYGANYGADVYGAPGDIYNGRQGYSGGRIDYGMDQSRDSYGAERSGGKGMRRANPY